MKGLVITNSIAIKKLAEDFIEKEKAKSKQEEENSKLIVNLEEIAVKFKNQGVAKINGSNFTMSLDDENHD
jgi:hypothetical protein